MSTSEQKFVAFFDVLGFKNLVEKNTHDDLVNIYKQTLYETVKGIKKVGLKHHANDDKALQSINSIEQFIISDSIVFIQSDFTHRGLFFLIVQSNILMKLAMLDGIPLRGSISLGPITVLKNFGTTVVGKGLTNAYSIESSQNWSGALIDPKCFEIHPNDNFFINLLSEKLNKPFIKYDIPLKNNKTFNGYALNWVGKNFNEENIVNAFSMHHKEIQGEKEQLLIDNTIKFYHFVKQMLEDNEIENKALFFFQSLMAKFNVSVKTVSKESFNKMLEVTDTDTWDSYLLRSEYYSLTEESSKSYITHLLTNKTILIKCKKPNVLEKKELSEIEAFNDGFESFKKLSHTKRVNVLIKVNY